MNENCDHHSMCRGMATHELVQVYTWEGRVHRRTLRYCDVCFENLHRRHYRNWLNGGYQERDAPENQVRPRSE